MIRGSKDDEENKHQLTDKPPVFGGGTSCSAAHMAPSAQRCQWEFQDPKMKVLYQISGHILWGYSLKFRPEKIGQKYMESVPPINRILKLPLKMPKSTN